jgi:hypothetical protein
MVPSPLKASNAGRKFHLIIRRTLMTQERDVLDFFHPVRIDKDQTKAHPPDTRMSVGGTISVDIERVVPKHIGTDDK